MPALPAGQVHGRQPARAGSGRNARIGCATVPSCVQRAYAGIEDEIRNGKSFLLLFFKKEGLLF
jgi:hypothetical protein